MDRQFVEEGFLCPSCDNHYYVTMIEKLQHVQGKFKERDMLPNAIKTTFPLHHLSFKRV